MRSTRTIRADIPTDVWDRLAAEAAEKGVPLGRLLRSMLVSRDRRIHPDVSRNGE